MNPYIRIFEEYTRLIEGMYEKTNYGLRARSKQTYRGGVNAGLDASVDVLKIAIENAQRELTFVGTYKGHGVLIPDEKKGDRIVLNNG